MMAGPLGRAFDATNDPLRIGSLATTQLFDALPDSPERMFDQQLQHPHILFHSRTRTVTVFQTFSKFVEHLRQLPLAVHVGMIHCRRSSSQCDQVMQRVENLIPFLVTSGVSRDHGVLKNNLHTINVTLDAHRLKRTVTRHAVIHVVEPGELIFVDLRIPANAGIESTIRQSNSVLFVLFQASANRFRLTRTDPFLFFQTTFSKNRIEFLEIFDLRHRSRPFSLKCFDPVLHNRLLVSPGRQAEQRLENIVARQSGITPVDPAGSTAQNGVGDRFGIVPPDFFGNAVKKIKRLRHAFENRFGSLRGKRNRKRGIRVRPDQYQHIHFATTVGEIDLDFSKVCFDPLTGLMIERDECFALLLAMFDQKPPNRGITSLVTMLGGKSLEDSHDCVTLFRRSRFVVFENL